MPAQVIDKGIPSAGLLTQVLVAKYADHQPLYRQETIFERAGVAIPRSTLAQWVGACGVRLQPLVYARRRDDFAWFERYDWPGNIRELEHLTYREFLLADGPLLTIPFPPSLRCASSVAVGASSMSYKDAKAQAIHEFESHFLRNVIERVHGNVSAAARLCGTERRHFRQLMKKYQIVRPSQ